MMTRKTSGSSSKDNSSVEQILPIEPQDGVGPREEGMNRLSIVRQLGPLLLAAILIAGCGSTSPPIPAPLDGNNLNLIFVVSEDLNFSAPGDLNPGTANLTNRGLQRVLMMGSFLKQRVLGGGTPNGIYALEAMTHLQTANMYPDIVALETIQQFAMLNQFTIVQQGYPTATANSYPIFASYLQGSVPDQSLVAPPVFYCDACQGLDFTDDNGDNEVLLSGILEANVPGYYVFSAPWETVSAVLASTNQMGNYNLPIPARYAGPNIVYAIAITHSGSATLLTYDSQLNPPFIYPVLPSLANVSRACPAATINIQVTGGVGGAVIPAGINTNETVYMIRHADAHPTPDWDDGNYIGAGQWRALYLPEALSGKIQPSEVYSIDPTNDIPAAVQDAVPSSYVRPLLTAAPYAIANNLPYSLAASVPVFRIDQSAPNLATLASNFFFASNRPNFSNKTILVAWEHDHIPPTVNALITSYGVSQAALSWSDSDYDSIWTIQLDAQGNLSVDNALCEGIDSNLLPSTPPQF